MKITRIQELSKYNHWLEKAKYEVELYKQTSGVYELVNIFLSLNALPEWIAKSDEAPGSLRDLADKKIEIMQKDDKYFKFDNSKLDELDHKLRLIRMFCNHTKHAKHKEGSAFPKISTSASFPISFPVKFDHLDVGDISVEALPLLESVIGYWEAEITKAEAQAAQSA